MFRREGHHSFSNFDFQRLWNLRVENALFYLSNKIMKFKRVVGIVKGNKCSGWVQAVAFREIISSGCFSKLLQ